jgi:hypothetical protein
MRKLPSQTCFYNTYSNYVNLSLWPTPKSYDLFSEIIHSELPTAVRYHLHYLTPAAYRLD